MTNKTTADLSSRIKATTARLTEAKVAVATIERELNAQLREVETLRRGPGRPRKEERGPVHTPRKRNRRTSHHHNGVTVGQA